MVEGEYNAMISKEFLNRDLEAQKRMIKNELEGAIKTISFK